MSDEAFEREKASYTHNSAQMRALNEQMNKVPPISITLTGGLWFAASQAPVPDIIIKFGLLVFAGIANIGLILACYRIRDVLQSYLDKIKEFEPRSFATGRPEKPVLERFSHYSMITVYSALMGSAALMSYVGAFFFYWPVSFEYRWLGIVVFLIIHGIAVGFLLLKKAA
jgi:hypothetical protein